MDYPWRFRASHLTGKLIPFCYGIKQPKNLFHYLGKGWLYKKHTVSELHLYRHNNYRCGISMVFKSNRFFLLSVSNRTDGTDTLWDFIKKDPVAHGFHCRR